MKNEYFVPDITDLRVGYVCEVNRLAIDDKQPDVWVYTTIKKVHQIEAAEKALNLKYLRVPYLTKEQIEAEGWRWIGQGYDGAITYGYGKNNHQITIWPNPPVHYQNAVVAIQITDNDGNIEYDGECKSINEFRFICKLLKI